MNLSQIEVVSTAEKDSGVLSLLIQRHRIRLSNYIVEQCKGKVIRGPFSGMILPHASGGWGDADRGAMALGLYEQEILSLIEKVAPRDCIFVNLGAADGYYGIGMLKAGIASHSHCFEIEQVAREKLKSTAELNGVSSRLSIYDKAGPDFINQIGPHESSVLFVICDTEGAEIEIFSDLRVFSALRYAHIVIEIHDWDESLKKKTQNLIKLASDTHRPNFLKTSSRDLSEIDILRTLDDTNRWMICSEGRPRMMEWCHLRPIGYL